MGREPVLELINHATSSTQLVIYGLTDKKFINALTKSAEHGVEINVLLEPTPYRLTHQNDFAFEQIHSSKIHLKTPNPTFHFTHQKTFIFDQAQALIMTFNLTNSTFQHARNFAVLITDPDMIKEIQMVFSKDAQHMAADVKNPNLVWAPNNSRDKILDFIHSAKSEIDIYAENLTDYQIAGALAKAAHHGVKVNILSSTYPNTPPLSKELNYLIRAGATIHLDHDMTIHAKVILVDHKKAMIGSINLTRNSIDHNRELSVITEDKDVIKALSQTFNDDWSTSNLAAAS